MTDEKLIEGMARAICLHDSDPVFDWDMQGRVGEELRALLRSQATAALNAYRDIMGDDGK